MTEKMKIFAQQFLIDHDCARAYMVAYPNYKNPKAAFEAGQKLLQKKEVRDFLEGDNKIAREEEVMAYLTSVMRGEEKDEIAIRTGKDCQEIAQIKPDTKDRMKAAELLAKRYGISEDKAKDISQGVIIKDDLYE